MYNNIKKLIVLDSEICRQSNENKDVQFNHMFDIETDICTPFNDGMHNNEMIELYNKTKSDIYGNELNDVFENQSFDNHVFSQDVQLIPELDKMLTKLENDIKEIENNKKTNKMKMDYYSYIKKILDDKQTKTWTGENIQNSKIRMEEIKSKYADENKKLEDEFLGNKQIINNKMKELLILKKNKSQIKVINDTIIDLRKNFTQLESITRHKKKQNKEQMIEELAKHNTKTNFIYVSSIILFPNEQLPIDEKKLFNKIKEMFKSLMKKDAYDRMVDLDSLSISNIRNINPDILINTLSTLQQTEMTIKNKLTEILTTLYKLKILHFNCRVRNIEGKFINQSLDSLKTDMSNIIKKNIINETLFYDKDVFPYCRDILTDFNSFDVFYKLQEQGIGNGVIIKAIQELLTQNNDEKFVDLDRFNKLKFIILSVINLTGDEHTNNPPNPPYINLYELIYYTMIYNDNDKEKKIKDSLKKVLEKTITYDFYNSNKTIIDTLQNINALPNYENVAKDIITLIKRNNASTLIGGLEIADSIQSLTYNMLPCSDVPEFKHKLDKFTNPSFKLNHMDYTTLNYQKKYNKYKHKYIQLKNKLKSQ